ncbi:MAG TPA: SRPBCC family protein [Dehalococcoidia bacterium]|nr:SRPBCC family protein [Dehalococcoidia bacterium]
MASVTESRVIAAPPEEVWEVLADVENARRWNRAWTQIDITSSQRHGLGTTFKATTESGDVFAFEITKWSPTGMIAFAPLRDEQEHYGIVLDSHTFRLIPAEEDATLVQLTARATAHGLRGHFVARLFWPGYQRHGLELALDALQAVFEPEAFEPEEEDEAAEAETPAPE